MKVTFSTDWTRPVMPGVVQRFLAGWSGELPDDLAGEAVAAGVASAEDAPADAGAPAAGQAAVTGGKRK